MNFESTVKGKLPATTVAVPGHVAASMTAPVLAPLEPEAAAPDAPLDEPELDPDEDPLFDDPLLEPLFDDPLLEPLLEPLFDDPLFEPLFEPLLDDPELPLDAVVPGVLEAQAP
jgi:hypothetical protein